MTDERSDRDLSAWIEAVNDDGVNLTSWEEEFMRDITKKWAKRRVLSDKEQDVLERIYTDRVP